MYNAAGESFAHQPHLAQRLNMNTAIHIIALCASYGMLQGDLYLYITSSIPQGNIGPVSNCSRHAFKFRQIKRLFRLKRFVDFLRLSHLGNDRFLLYTLQ